MRCEKCNVEVKIQSWPYHLKSKNLLENDPDQTLNQSSMLNCVKNVM